MKGKFITTQIMIVCMGNKQSAKSIKGHHERMTESISKLMVGSMAQPVIALAEDRNRAA